MLKTKLSRWFAVAGMFVAVATGLAGAAEVAPTGASLLKNAATLEAAGQYRQAATAYNEAREAFLKEENQVAAGRVLVKLDEVLKRDLAENPVPPTPVPSAKVPPLPKPLELPPLAPKAGRLAGRIINEMGGPIPNFTVKYSGFEDGKLIINNSENVAGEVKGAGGAYSIALPPGAYRVAVYVTYLYRGRTYNFEAEPINPPARHDFNGLGLDYLKDGLVRDFVLKMTAKRANAWEDTGTGYLNAYYGGRVDIDCEHFGAGAGAPPPLYSTIGTHPYPPDSRVHVTLTPQGPLVDGSTGKVVEIDLRLGDNGLYQQCKRGIFPGLYTATAVLNTPSGETVPLRLSRKGSADGQDATVMAWGTSVMVDFLPNDLGLKTPMGVKAFGLFPAK